MSTSPVSGSPVALPFSTSEYESRVRATQDLMEREHWDALLVYSSRIFPGTVRYLTGYETRLGIHDAAYLLILLEDGPRFTLFSNASWDHPEEQTWVKDIVITSNFGLEIASRLKDRDLAVVGYKYLPAPVYCALQHRFRDVNIVDATEPVVRLRAIKSPREIEILRYCTELTDNGGHEFLRAVRPGVTERAVAADVERAIRGSGSDEFSFSTQVGCGERTARVVVFPTDRIIQQGDPVQLDCGATAHGYRGDLSRVAVVGRPTGDYERMLETCAEMYSRCVEELKPGVTADHIAHVGIDIAKAHHLDQYLYRSPNHEPGFMGHGIGCHYSEYPELYPEDHTVLRENMVLVIEPILMRPGVGGVKIEDAVLVTKHGAQRVSSCPIRTWSSN
ncbi:MAG TPA: Xaa-Pro peptidase family protein [Candidatus Dormibacteraeota bacterium]|nr:Xaa-Pro peptidase family protein [Candidatus Dormibacteraeota bacterium]